MTLTLVLVGLAAIIDGFMDKIMNMYDTSIFINNPKFNQNLWNPTLSWRNKYKNGDPTQGPKFFGSTTFLVWTTDAWHLFKVIFQVSILLLIIFPTSMSLLEILLIIPLFWGLLFELTLNFLTKK